MADTFTIKAPFWSVHLVINPDAEPVAIDIQNEDNARALFAVLRGTINGEIPTILRLVRNAHTLAVDEVVEEETFPQ